MTLGEVEPGRPDADANLARPRDRVRRLPHLEHLGPAVPCDQDRSHVASAGSLARRAARRYEPAAVAAEILAFLQEV